MTSPAASARGPDGEGERVALLLLRLLTGDGAPIDEQPVDWARLVDVARRNAVLIRAAGELARRGMPLPEAQEVEVEHERWRARAAVRVSAIVTRSGAQHDIPLVFPKVTRHLPDVGDDIDLLVASRSRRVDGPLLEELPSVAQQRRIDDRMARRVVYRVAACPLPLDIHHGCLGDAGEDGRFARIVLEGRRRVTLDGLELSGPSPEDEVVLQGAQRAFGRRRIRISDAVHAILAVRSIDLDWDRVLATARATGALPGLACFLEYVEQAYRRAYQGGLLPTELRRALPHGRWGEIRIDRDGMHFPTVRVTGALYARRLGRYVLSGQWGGAMRLCLYPLATAATMPGRLARRRARRSRPDDPTTRPASRPVA